MTKLILSSKRSLENRIFNICCFGILVLSISNTIFGGFLKFNIRCILLNHVILFFMIFMLYISNKNQYSKKYSKIASFVLNLIIFPLLYLCSNKLESGIYFYFLLGIIMSSATLGKKERSVAAAIDIFIQFSLILYSQFNVTYITIVDKNLFYMAIIIGFLITSIAFASIIIVMLVCYEAKTNELQMFNSYLKEISDLDELTGLWNRKHMDKSLKEQVNLAKTCDVPLSIVMFDIDLFKSVNDTYGHQTGDQVLSSLGKLFRKNIRSRDIASRYGGEEFMLILPHTDAKTALMIAERIREKVSREIYIKKDMRRITISGGIGIYNKNMTVSQLVKEADDNLYKAKKEGRNKIVMKKAH